MTAGTALIVAQQAQGRGGRRDGGLALVAILNRVSMPGGLHPLLVVATAVLIAAAILARRRQRAARGLISRAS